MKNGNVRFFLADQMYPSCPVLIEFTSTISDSTDSTTKSILTKVYANVIEVNIIKDAIESEFELTVDSTHFVNVTKSGEFTALNYCQGETKVIEYEIFDH